MEATGVGGETRTPKHYVLSVVGMPIPFTPTLSVVAVEELASSQYDL